MALCVDRATAMRPPSDASTAMGCRFKKAAPAAARSGLAHRLPRLNGVNDPKQSSPTAPPSQIERSRGFCALRRDRHETAADAFVTIQFLEILFMGTGSRDQVLADVSLISDGLNETDEERAASQAAARRHVDDRGPKGPVAVGRSEIPR